MTAQDLPYRQIPDYPTSYSAGTVAARMIDGLGFRYYWATQGLRAEDLAFKPSEEARTQSETLDHILGLSQVILNAALKKPNTGAERDTTLTFDNKRTLTLNNIKQAADILRKAPDSEMVEFKVIFSRGENAVEYPFWNNINGPIADAIWHCGQVVTFRRSSGNPFNSKASVFSGKLRE